jgi:hypothetical protein
MKTALALASIALALGIASAPARAQSYVVNGHAASPAEVQRLVASGIPPGQWSVNGFGISATGNGSVQAAARPSGRKCWYVLDELLCD